MNNRLMVAAVAFLALLGGLIYVVNQRADDDAPDSESTEVPELPEISRDAITSVTITRPGDGDEPETVTLGKVGDVWRVTAPIDADADETAIDTVLDKLSELEVQGIAATNPENHERLEVADNGIRVEVKAGDEVIANLIIGAYRSRNTMVRVEGQDTVVTVRGSIKYAFNKELKDWRNRRVANEDPADVVAARFESENGVFEFLRNAESEWVQAEGAEEIERFGPTKVQSIVSSIARMRAVNFADEGVTREATGLDTPSGTVTLTIRSGSDSDADAEGDAEAEAEGDAEGDAEGEAEASATRTIVLRVGAPSGEDENGERYLEREGDATVYVVSNYLADRMRPDIEKFQAPEPGSEPEEPPGGMMPGLPGLPPGIPGHGGPGGGNPQIPPELMQKIQQQLQQQGATMG